VPRYKHLAVKRISLDSLKVGRLPKEPTPRQKAIMERDDEIRAALNEAAALPASEAVAIELKEGQKLPTLRAAINRIMAVEPRDLNFAVRGQTLYVSRGQVPGGRNSRRRDAER
jgi:hypothetical protein